MLHRGSPHPGVIYSAFDTPRALAHPDWLLGCEDEVWWSRLAHPALHAWQDDDHPLHVIEQTVAHDDPAPKALACYGLLARCWADRTQRREELWLRIL